MSNGTWLVITFLLALGIIYYYRRSLQHTINKERELSHQQSVAHQLQLNNERMNFQQQLKAEQDDKIRIANNAQEQILKGVIEQAITQMDNVCSYYTNEDEASRELTSCLNVLGHKAIYHYPLGDSRTADIFVDNCIIESKLDPPQGEIDRLVGQVKDYSDTLSYHICIVIFGKIGQDTINRLNRQVLDNDISLVYLTEPKRIRQPKLPY